MSTSTEPKQFKDEWFELAKVIAERIYADSEVQHLRQSFEANKKLTFEERSNFITIANRIKYEVIHETYGPDGSESFNEFKKRWRDWYDNKGVISTSQAGRRLTNEEHIIYSSTPEAEEFFINFATK